MRKFIITMKFMKACVNVFIKTKILINQNKY